MKLIIKQSDNDERFSLLHDQLDPRWETDVVDEHDDAAFSRALSEADALISMDWRWSHAVPKLKLVQLPGAGTDGVEFAKLPPATSVCNVFGHDISISEYVLASMLEMTIGLSKMNQALRQDRWTGSYLCGPRHGELFGRTLGIIGYGHIGREVARRARAFGMSVIACTRTPKTGDEFASRVDAMDQLDRLLAESDFILVAAPLNDETLDLLNATRFEKMKPNAIIINVGRGTIINETALFHALKSKRIAGAAIDTWYHYPRQGLDYASPSQHPFHELDNIIMTPHASGWTDNLKVRRCAGMAENLNHLIRGEPLINIVKKGQA